jgi:hypothetical protein
VSHLELHCNINQHSYNSALLLTGNAYLSIEVNDRATGQHTEGNVTPELEEMHYHTAAG